MDDRTLLTNEKSVKLFIQRDFSEGIAVKFQERFPSELNGKIDQNEFVKIIRDINEIFAEAETMSCNTFMENCCACLTGYLLLLCISTHYEKCVKRAAAYIAGKNDTVLNRHGIFMVDPMEKGLRCSSIVLLIFNDAQLRLRLDRGLHLERISMIKTAMFGLMWAA